MRRIAATLTAVGLLAGCGETHPANSRVDSPPDSATSFLDDPCKRQGAERRKLLKIGPDGFRPRKIIVPGGSAATWINCDDEPHTVTQISGPGSFDSGTLDPGERFGYTFTAPGTIRYRDEENAAATGVIEVRGLPEKRR